VITETIVGVVSTKGDAEVEGPASIKASGA
jgi:hypothetical protein